MISRSSSSGKVKWNERTTGGRGNSHTPMRVTMPKFDCVNSPSRIGPKLYFDVCQLIRSLESSAPSPVRSYIAVAEHDFEPAGESEMIEIGRIAGALVERIADH